MTPGPELFDAASLQLRPGINLVEASAGTGKTFAISMLLLRAICELGLTVDSILVVTFTRAATEELRGRIRARLAQARDLLDNVPNDYDQVLQCWRQQLADPRQARLRLQLALYDIDRAEIFTIHSFCQRMLRDQALESGEPFASELADIASLRAEITADFWRHQLYGLPAACCMVISGHYANPHCLYQSIAESQLGHGRIVPGTASFAETAAVTEACHENLQAWWQANSERLREYFAAAIAAGSFNKPVTADWPQWWQLLTGYLTGEGAGDPAGLQWLQRENLLAVLNKRKLSSPGKGAAFLAGWPLPESLASALMVANRELLLSLRVELAHHLRVELPRRLQERGLVSFDELIRRLAGALDDRKEGAVLRRQLRKRYQMALIDEFQDTDNWQWQIFSTLFAGGQHYLYLIGDPKQAIYKFRGADIYSYFQARQQANQLLTLAANFRSHPLLVEEINNLFASRRQPFLFDEEQLPYVPVAAARRHQDGHLSRGGSELPVMQYWYLDPPPPDEGESKAKPAWTVDEIETICLRHCLEQIRQLLDPASKVQYNSCKLPPTRPLAAADIAVLVRTNRQAEQVVKALTGIGIAAVVDSHLSVFASQECQELLIILSAMAEPGALRQAKSALAISWFPYRGDQLEKLWNDPLLVNDWLARLHDYNRCWRQQGVLAAVSQLLRQEDVYQTLAAGSRGERRLANIFQLLELLGQAELESGVVGRDCLRWLQRQMTGGDNSDTVELRLESDLAAVQVVTMHGAKGLEYPVVFCPFLWQRSAQLGRTREQVSYHEEDLSLAIDLGSGFFSEHKTIALREELAEQLRLLYVALTRAAVCCHLYCTSMKTSGPEEAVSALGYLLFADTAGDAGQQRTLLQQRQRPGVAVDLLDPGLPPPEFLATSAASEQLATRLWTRDLNTSWQITSFSALAARLDDESQASGSPAARPAGQLSIALPGLPAGTQFGNLIHAGLDQLDFSALADDDEASALVAQLCQQFGVAADYQQVRQLLKITVSCPLPDLVDEKKQASWRLTDLAPQVLVKEMPFQFSLRSIQTAQISSLLRREECVAPLASWPVSGYLTGFIDLFCEHQGRYYILDYKTNYLGEWLENYHRSSLQQAMLEHNYGLQYWLYTVAVHRWLRQLRPEYQYEKHFGGIYYLFVRGLHPEHPGCGVYATRPDPATLCELDALLGEQR